MLAAALAAAALAPRAEPAQHAPLVPPIALVQAPAAPVHAPTAPVHAPTAPVHAPTAPPDEPAHATAAAAAARGEVPSFDPITGAEIRDHIDVLASDVFEGREAGTAGERRAAAYLVSMLEEIDGLQPGGTGGDWLQPFALQGDEERIAHNVVALLPGSDPALAHETIVVGAHYDHVGWGRSGSLASGTAIHNGADDNASGSAVVLELAEALASAPRRPRRTVAFHWYSGEESGLLGSLHYVGHPLRPLDDTVFMLNLDMVGRLVGRTLEVGGTATSPVLGDVCRMAADAAGLRMLENPVGNAPSDSESFYNARIPVVFLFTGVHRDYHRPSDDAELVNAEGAERVARMAHEILRAVDELDERPPFAPASGRVTYWAPRAFHGVVLGRLDDDVDGAARVSIVLPDSPGARAGLREGDVVVSVDGVRLCAVREVQDALEPEGFELHPRLLGVVRPARRGEPERAFDVLVQPVVR